MPADADEQHDGEMDRHGDPEQPAPILAQQDRRDEHRRGDIGEGRPIGVRARQECLRGHQQQHRHGESEQQALRPARRRLRANCGHTSSQLSAIRPAAPRTAPARIRRTGRSDKSSASTGMEQRVAQIGVVGGMSEGGEAVMGVPDEIRSNERGGDRQSRIEPRILQQRSPVCSSKPHKGQGTG